MTVLGLDGWRFLSSTDPTDLLLLQALRVRVDQLRESERKLAAIEIVNALAKAMNR
jgi:hypothetical protein